ncbi:MAG: LytTR family DNA-binding domain-containing protein [Burkholderiaceae bacterium]
MTTAPAPAALRALVVDDEPLARSRMRVLLEQCPLPTVRIVGEAATAGQALEMIGRERPDVVLLDIHMPGSDGLTLARHVAAMPDAPAVVFVTAHAEHALQAFELEAVDYVTKPVRLSRLALALQKVERRRLAAAALQPEAPAGFLTIQDRGRTERVPVSEVVYLKAELKYITLRTAERSLILDGSLSDIEERHRAHFLRIHRNALVARQLVRALEKHFDEEEGEGWAVRLHGVDEVLAVSRRQLAAVRELLNAGA